MYTFTIKKINEALSRINNNNSVSNPNYPYSIINNNNMFRRFDMNEYVNFDISTERCLICKKNIHESSLLLKCQLCRQDVCKSCSIILNPLLGENERLCGICFSAKNDKEYHFCETCHEMYFLPKGLSKKKFEEMITNCLEKYSKNKFLEELITNRFLAKCNKCINEIWQPIKLIWVGATKNGDNNECHFNKLPNEIIKEIIHQYIMLFHVEGGFII
jgi:hypothetical protein